MSKHSPDVGCTMGTRLEPGTYSAYCARADVYFERFYKRWVCLLQFDVTDASGFNVLGRIPRWFNLGKRDKPHIGRRSEYFKAWVKANDGNPPKRANRLSPAVFLKRVAKVQIADVGTELPYSVAREILSWETGISGINQSNNQPINIGIPEAGENKTLIRIACQSERRATCENDAPVEVMEAVKVSALAGVESQPKPTQRRETDNSLPQRHYNAQLPEVNIEERRALLKAQAARVIRERYETGTKTDANAMQVHKGALA